MADIRHPLRYAVVAPPALHAAVGRWTSGGQQAQPLTAWSLESWMRFLPEHEKMLRALPDGIARADVAALAADIHTPDHAVTTFVAAMVWGFGKVGYGPYRTARVLAKNRDAGDHLAELARRVGTDGGPDAFNWFAKHRLEGLGVAFSTKFMFFCNSEPATPALVLDQLVSNWFHANAAWRPKLDWNTRDYRDYVDTIVRWSHELGIRPADTELLIFQDQVRKAPSSQWAASVFDEDVALLAAEDATDDDSGLSRVDRLLHEIANEMHGRLGLTGDDLDDVEHDLRSLRRIAAKAKSKTLLPERS